MRSLLIAVAILPLLSTAAELQPIEGLRDLNNSVRIGSPCLPAMPFTVAGEHGAIFGRQNGRFEAWLWPVKILSDFRIQAELADYAVPIDVNALAAHIEVTPAETVITYSHAAFTIRQHMFAPRGGAAPGTGAVVYFEIESLRPLDLTFSFTPEMLRMWPAPNFGRPNGEWVTTGGEHGGGYYVLHTDNPEFSALVAMPRATPGILVPYQEHPQTFPLQFKLAFDPKRDRGEAFPLIFALASPGDAAVKAAAINAAIPKMREETAAYYEHFFERRLVAETPDTRLNDALRWAEISVDQMQVAYHDEIGMVAGYYESADSARPGYAWFFGRDTLWTTFAINSYGDGALTRRALDFLIKRQRSDGKIMHEFSQSAEAIDWKATPYFYASADATPLLVMAMWDYVRTTGDTAYLQKNWDTVERAYTFTRSHEADDGIYSNSEGTGWVESWPPGMPHEEIYLAALDEQSAAAMSRLAAVAGKAELAARAANKAHEIAAHIEAEYYEPGRNFYAFSRGADGTLDHTASIYPTVAWWDGAFSLENADAMLSRWASPEFSTDWGTRDISPSTSFYDAISYHQGSIWPLFTGWTSVAEYHAGRPLSGYAHLMQNVGLTWAQDLGAVTELLSGEYFQPLGRSSSHQMWSSAMVISPLLRGLFGLNWDVPHHTLQVAPALPADWPGATLRNVPFGSTSLTLTFERNGNSLTVRATTPDAEVLCLTKKLNAEPASCNSAASSVHSLQILLPPIELSIPSSLPDPGSTTAQLKILDERYRDHEARFTFSAPGGTALELPVRLHEARVSLRGGTLAGDQVRIQFPGGPGYQQQIVTFSW